MDVAVYVQSDIMCRERVSNFGVFTCMYVLMMGVSGDSQCVFLALSFSID